jgi:phosphopantothenoylcysteine decarboxylase/phosphopantothenate--cysteine ligase
MFLLRCAADRRNQAAITLRCPVQITERDSFIHDMGIALSRRPETDGWHAGHAGAVSGIGTEAIGAELRREARAPQAALDRGARVTLITAPNTLPTPVGAERVDVRSTAEMAEAVLSASTDAGVLIMAAAVADFRPETEAGQKIKRGGVDDDGAYDLRLTKTIDILATVAERRKQTGRPTIVVGFAAETQNLLENAREKLRKKKLSLLVANDVSAKDAGFFVDTNRVTIIDAGGGAQTLPLMSKAEVAEAVCERVERLL